jgi:DNA polymerase III subunit delta'
MRAVVGHQHARELLSRAVAAGQVSHAYLLTGPAQIGKSTLARGFAQLLECEQPDAAAGLPCGECGACRRVAHGTHPDVMVVEAADGKRSIPVDDVRAAIARANLSPSEGRWRVFILRDVEQLTASAVNALLRTLEEPPPQVVLLLTSAEPETLLPTLLSRCQSVALLPLAATEVESALVGRWGIAATEARGLAALANGRLGWAVEAHARPALREERARLLAELAALTQAGRAERLKAAGTLASDTETARAALALWTLWWRDVTLASCGATHLAGAGAARKEAERQGRLLTPGRTHAFLRALLAAQVALDQNANPRLTFDVLMLDLPRLAAG